MSRDQVSSEHPAPVAESGPNGDPSKPVFPNPLSCQLAESYPLRLSEDQASHVLSVIQAYTGREGTGKPNASGLVWHGGYAGASVALTNEGGGTRAEVSMNPVLPWFQAGSIGLVSGFVLAGVLEPITFGVFVGSVSVGLGVGLGAGIAFAKWTRRRVAGLVDKISQTMANLDEWSVVAAGRPADSGSEVKANAQAAEAARNVERLGALQDRREALGARVTVRRASYSLAVGATLAAILPTALQFTPIDYPLPWIIVGVLCWILVKVLRSLFRGIRERKHLDAEIQALLDTPGVTPGSPVPARAP